MCKPHTGTGWSVTYESGSKRIIPRSRFPSDLRVNEKSSEGFKQRAAHTSAVNSPVNEEARDSKNDERQPRSHRYNTQNRQMTWKREKDSAVRRLSHVEHMFEKDKDTQRWRSWHPLKPQSQQQLSRIPWCSLTCSFQSTADVSQWTRSQIVINT